MSNIPSRCPKYLVLRAVPLKSHVPAESGPLNSVSSHETFQFSPTASPDLTNKRSIAVYAYSHLLFQVSSKARRVPIIASHEQAR